MVVTFSFGWRLLHMFVVVGGFAVSGVLLGDWIVCDLWLGDFCMSIFI